LEDHHELLEHNLHDLEEEIADAHMLDLLAGKLERHADSDLARFGPHLRRMARRSRDRADHMRAQLRLQLRIDDSRGGPRPNRSAPRFET
jgi:hypothetical protein